MEDIYYFEDWVSDMLSSSDYSDYELMCFEEHYQNLLTFKENTEIFIKQLEIMQKFEVLSPDRITIEFDIPYYTSKEKAFEAFDKWKKRYEFQGYYSSVDYGRIPLEELEDYMYVREISNDNLKIN